MRVSISAPCRFVHRLFPCKLFNEKKMASLLAPEAVENISQPKLPRTIQALEMCILKSHPQHVLATPLPDSPRPFAPHQEGAIKRDAAKTTARPLAHVKKTRCPACPHRYARYPACRPAFGLRPCLPATHASTSTRGAGRARLGDGSRFRANCCTGLGSCPFRPTWAPSRAIHWKHSRVSTGREWKQTRQHDPRRLFVGLVCATKGWR